MPRPTKHHEISKLLKQRIAAGAYLDQPIPGERAIAMEAGVSYMTARKAVQQLVEDNVLVREPNGRLATPEISSTSKASGTYTLIAPAYESYAYTHIRVAIERIVSQYKGILKVSGYRHWHDPSLMSVFDGDWDGIFIIPPLDGIPKLLLDRMQANAYRVVSVYIDLTDQGLVSLDNSRASWGNLMVDHLVSLGHDRVDCLNTQPGAFIKKRITAWQKGVHANGIQGRLWDEPVESFGYNWVKAYNVARAAIASGEMARAVCCTNLATAKGLARAAHELGLKLGTDIMYCTVDAAQEVFYEIPSITTFNLLPLDGFIQKAFDWFNQGDSVLNGNRSLTPRCAPSLLLGESTGYVSRADQIQLNQ